MTYRYSSVTRKGQVTIPAEIRQELNLKAGDIVSWQVDGNAIRLRPARFTLESAFGSVEPRNSPEDFESLENRAKAAKARETVNTIKRADPP